MKRAPHLLVALSAHGFGHTTQTAPVVNELRRRIPDLRLTLRGIVPHTLLRARFEGEFEHLPTNSDIGMVMSSALDVKVKESAEAYARFHQHWERKIQQEAQLLNGLAPDLLLSNVAYLPLAGAAAAGISAVAMCSLNWADIYLHYCAPAHKPAAEGRTDSPSPLGESEARGAQPWPEGPGEEEAARFIGSIHGSSKAGRSRPEAEEIHRQIVEAYNGAAGFLQTEPAMPMLDIAKRRPIGPVARVGIDRRHEINERLALSDKAHLVLIAPGGIALRLPVEQWPSVPDIYWIVQSDWNVNHPNVIILEQLGMHFTDVLRSCDALIGKPGYGSFAEAACNGTPVLYVKRNDWPEEPCLVDWLQRHGRCVEIDRSRLGQGEVLGHLETLWALPAPSPVVPSGITQAAEYLHAYLD